LASYDDASFSFKYAHNPRNGGFGQGNNVGVDNTSGDILLFLNPDTILVEPIFEELIRSVDQGFNIGGFRLVDLNFNDNDSIGLLPEYTWLSVPRSILLFLVRKSHVISKLVYPWGASLFVTRQSFLESGQFDEQIFLCNEEPDLIQRISNVNLLILEKYIIHLDGHTTELKSTRYDAFLDSTFYYHSKHNLNFSFFLFQSKLKMYVKICLKTVFFRNKEYEEMIVDRLSAFKRSLYGK
jgi:GT2 family glycosyltransferase